MKLAVLTPSFAYGRYISDCLNSVALQAPEEGAQIQHVVMDALSQDATCSVLTAFEHPLTWRSEADDGQSDALNKALREVAQADWIGWLNADEFYLPGVHSWLRTAALANPQADVIYGDALFVDDGARMLRRLSAHRPSRFALRYYGCYPKTCAVFVKREALEGDPWDVDLRRVMDWDLYLKLEAAGKVFHYQRGLVAAFRVHGDQVTAVRDERHVQELRLLRARYQIVESAVRRGCGRLLHAALKVRDGGKLAEHRARRLKGRDQRWWLRA